MRHILFVDDEAMVLEGLQRMLRSRRGEWEMSFVTSGEGALKLLEAKAFDVIVSDMRMPAMDGATLLTHVRDRFPNVVRIVLTGHTSLEASMRAVPVAHQFLAKPCEPGLLQAAVERACSLNASLDSELLRRAVGDMQELPALPRTYTVLTKALSDPDVSLHQIAEIVERDVAVSAKVLQLVNSPLFGCSRHVATIHTAVSYLGVNVLKDLVLSVESFRLFEDSTTAGGFSPEGLHVHSYLTARIAVRLPIQGHLKDTAYIAALLHDIGILVLMTKLPKHFARVVASVQAEERPMHVVEERLIGVTHAEIGAYLLGLWGLPYGIIESVAFHHAPACVPHQTFDALGAVHVANILAHEIEDSRLEGPHFTHANLDQHYLETLGVTDQLPAWRAIAANAAGM
jgi:HD-like signal output (HDOD) protein